jgi:hypothetical protein
VTVDEPVIDLGEQPRDGGEPVGDPEPRRPLTRRLLVLAGVGLLAVGFVAGMAVQRAATPTAAPTPSPSVLDYYQVNPQLLGCGAINHNDNPGWVSTDNRCTGTVRSVHGHTVALMLDSRATITFTVGADTELSGLSSIDKLRSGQYITVRLVTEYGRAPHAAWLTVS